MSGIETAIAVAKAFTPARVASLAAEGHPLLQHMLRLEDWYGERYVVALHEPWRHEGPKFTLTRVSDYERATFDETSGHEEMRTRIALAIRALGARLSTSLYRPTEAHRVNGEAVPGVHSLVDWMPEPGAGAGLFNGVDRNAIPAKLRPHRITAQGMLVREALVEADAVAAVAGSGDGVPVFVSGDNFGRLLMEGGDDRHISVGEVGTNGEVDVTWTPTGEAARRIRDNRPRIITVVPDDDCPDATGWRLPESAFGLVSLQAAPHMLGCHDERVLRRNPPEPENPEHPGNLEVRFVYYANTALFAPPYCVRIDGLGT